MFQPIDIKEFINKNKVLALIIAIIGFVLGILCLISPWYTGAALIWVMLGLVGVFAIISIIKFIFPGKGNKRNGASLAVAVILGLCVAAIIIIGVNAKDVQFKGEIITGFEATTIRLLCFGSIFFGVFAAVNNICLLCNVGNFPKEQKGWIIAKSILGIIVGLLTAIFPFIMFVVSMIIGGVYLIISCIALFALDIKYWNAK